MAKDPEPKPRAPRIVIREERQTDGLEISISGDEDLVGMLAARDLDRASSQSEGEGAPLAGERFGKYLLIGELAAGGMAEVSLGVQEGLQGYLKVVTIKRVLPHLNNAPDFVQMFIDEARLGARLEHPNIVRTYEFGEQDGQYYTVMEYLPGEDAAALLHHASHQRRPIPIHVAVHIVIQVCSGLHFAHELTDPSGNSLGLVHRDVNPSNVIVTYNGEVKIIDFGVAKANTNSTSTLAGTIKGKLAYMSPEQIEARGVDRRSDVFSTGVVLWELLTGRPLFNRESEAATLYAIVNDPIPSVRQYRADVPRELDAMVARALARAPSERFESCEVMQFALESLMGTQPKCDARLLARTMEQMFGTERAQAKRSIAQTRSLARNVSLVMKLRSDVRRNPSEKLAAKDGDALPTREGHPRPATAPTRRHTLGLIALVIGGAAAGAGYLALHGSPERPVQPAIAPAAVDVASTPSGAAIFIGQEPTGLVTPATLRGLAPGHVTIRVALSGYRGAETEIEVRAGQSTSQHLDLVRLVGRLVLAGLPAASTLWIDNREQLLGEIVTLPAGNHEVRIDVGATHLVQQTIETGAGDQTWQLQGSRLTYKARP